MVPSSPTHGQMVNSLAQHYKNNIEEVARRSGVPVGALHRALKKGARLRTWARQLKSCYDQHFPMAHFSPFFRLKDENLQAVFQKAVDANTEDRDRGPLSELFQLDWTWLSSWEYPHDCAGAHYLRARYALISGWTGVQLQPTLDGCAALELAIAECSKCLTELERTPDRADVHALTMMVLRIEVSAKQRLGLLKAGQYLPVGLAAERDALESLLKHLLSHVTKWKKGHFMRWQWARDAVTIASGLSLLDQCTEAYGVLLQERPDFDLDHEEWTVGPASEDPDLQFFRKNLAAIICQLVKREE